MDFPVHVSEYLGMNTVIAMIAIIHVMISHGAAVGGGTLVAYLEYKAIKTQNDELDRFAQRMLRVFVIVTTTVGALTGVGIWISTTVAQPASIGFLLRVFFWAWFVEWLVFITEIVLLFIYYFSWKRLSEPGKANHAKLGRYYAAASFGTLVLIVGVLSAMLTPGDWLTTGSFFDATFNPTMLPSLFFRLFLATSLAGIYSLILFRIFGPEQQEGQQRIIHLQGHKCCVNRAYLKKSFKPFYATVIILIILVEHSFKKGCTLVMKLPGLSLPWHWFAHRNLYMILKPVL